MHGIFKSKFGRRVHVEVKSSLNFIPIPVRISPDPLFMSYAPVKFRSRGRPAGPYLADHPPEWVTSRGPGGGEQAPGLLGGASLR